MLKRVISTPFIALANTHTHTHIWWQSLMLECIIKIENLNFIISAPQQTNTLICFQFNRPGRMPVKLSTSLAYANDRLAVESSQGWWKAGKCLAQFVNENEISKHGVFIKKLNWQTAASGTVAVAEMRCHRFDSLVNGIRRRHDHSKGTISVNCAHSIQGFVFE